MSHRSISVVLVLVLASTAAPLTAQDIASEPTPFSVEGYAVANYYRFDWETDPNRRNQLDLERFAVEPAYRVNAWLRFEAEIEFEHGGTGVARETAADEASGFETEVEKGGAVEIEKLEAEFLLHPAFNVRVGHLYVPVGLVSSHDEPDEYFTNARNETEVALIPTLWHETGVGVFGAVRAFRYQALLVNGLDATGFTSATWIVGGWQKRFEEANASGVAVIGRLDLDVGPESYVGVSGYLGNSAANRPGADLDVPAHVGLVEAHAVVRHKGLTARGLLLYGHLQNSAAVSAANATIVADPSPVGKAALGWFVEAGVDVLPLLTSRAAGAGREGVDVFVRYDWYDSMYRVAAGIVDDPRWRRKTVTAGINWRIHPAFLVKAEYAHRSLGLAGGNHEDTMALGFGLIYGD